MRSVSEKSASPSMALVVRAATSAPAPASAARRSITSSWIRVEHAALVEDSILFNFVSVGAGAKLRRCIIDKHVNIPAGETVGYDLEHDRQRFTVTEQGVVVIGRRDSF